jgi:hypothetical protein
MRVPRNFSITLTSKVLNTCKRVKYLDMVLDSDRKFGDHIELVCTRVDAIVGAIRGLLLNVNGPSNICRKLYYQVWE